MSKEEMEGAGLRSTPSKPEKRGGVSRRFTAKRVALMAVFVALSFVVSFLEIPLFPATPFLKLDFGNVFILLISFLLGPIEGVLVCLCKEGFRCLLPSATYVGELANFLMTSAYILLPSVAYRFHKGLKVVVPCLVAACFIGTATALLVNRFITFPLYMGGGAKTVFFDVFWWIVAFNLVKTVSVGLLTVLLYKRLSNFLKKWKI